MVENLVSTYTCPFCSGKNISEKNIDIVWAAWNTVNIDMHCPTCDKHFMAKTEVVQMELGNVTADKLAQIQKSLLALKGKLWWNIEIEADIIREPFIQDINILELRKNMQQEKFEAKDLFSEEWEW